MTQPARDPITHGQIFKRHRGPISGTFALLGLENALQVAEPFVLGMAIDALLQQNWRGFLILCAVEAGILIVGVARRAYDTRVYTKVYAEVGGRVVEAEQAKGAPMTKVSARATLVKEVVDFFEQDLPIAATSIIGVVGSLAMILFLNGRVFLAALAAAAGTMVIFALASGRITRLNGDLNDELEKQISVFETRRPSMRRRHFLRLARTRVQLSDFESLNFGLTYAFLMAAILYGLFDSVTRQEASLGTVFAIVTYLTQFTDGVIMLPYTYQQLLRTREITKRIGSENGETDG
jgi:ABC-type multidrug transport system fused ATPase/permease subunit